VRTAAGQVSFTEFGEKKWRLSRNVTDCHSALAALAEKNGVCVAAVAATSDMPVRAAPDDKVTR